MSDDGGSSGCASLGRTAAREAALYAEMADANDEIAHLLRKAVEAVAPRIDDRLAAIPAEIADAVQADAYHLLTFQRLTADTARAYDEFIAADYYEPDDLPDLSVVKQ